MVINHGLQLMTKKKVMMTVVFKEMKERKKKTTFASVRQVVKE